MRPFDPFTPPAVPPSRQVLEQAVTWELIDRNPSDRIVNRRVKLDQERNTQPFASWEEVDAVSAELLPHYRAIPAFLVEARACDPRRRSRSSGVTSTRGTPSRRWSGSSQGRTKAYKKSTRQKRRVPLRGRVLEALRQHPRRLDSRLVFPGHDGDYLKQMTFRQVHWTPALRAAGVEHRRVYDCRHTFATWAIAAGVQLFYLSRIMGTSITMIDQHYGHLVPDSEDYLRGLLDTYDAGTFAQIAEG